jgi:hypothetical protein
MILSRTNMEASVSERIKRISKFFVCLTIHAKYNKKINFVMLRLLSLSFEKIIVIVSRMMKYFSLFSHSKNDSFNLTMS